jgi:hypothetical protein
MIKNKEKERVYNKYLKSEKCLTIKNNILGK